MSKSTFVQGTFIIAMSFWINSIKSQPMDLGFGNQITDVLQSQMSTAQSQVQNIGNSLSSATSMAQNYGNMVQNSIQDVVSKFSGAVEQLYSGAMGDGAMSCLSQSVQFEELAGKVQNNVMSCITNGLGKLTSQSTSTTVEIGKFMVIFTQLAAQVQLCTPQGMNYLPCVMETWISVMSKSPDSWISLMGEIGKLLADLGTFQFTIVGCGFTSSMADLAKEATQSFNRIKECMANIFPSNY